MSITNLNANYAAGSYSGDLERLLKLSENDQLSLADRRNVVLPEMLIVQSDENNAFIGYGIDLKENSTASIEAALSVANAATVQNVVLSKN